MEAQGFAKSFGTTRALVRCDVTLRAGEIHGLVGHNGSGKSTFIRTLAGYHEPDAGQLTIRGEQVPLPIKRGGANDLGLAFIHQDLGLLESLSVLDNMCLTELATRRGVYIAWPRERAKTRTDLAELGAEVPLGVAVGRLRPVDRALIAAARAFAALSGKSGRVLFCDEVTSYLPTREIAELYQAIGALRARGDAVLMVSHDLAEVLQHADRVTVMRNGTTIATMPTDEADLEMLSRMLMGDAPKYVPAVGAAPGPAVAHAASFVVSGLSTARVRNVGFAINEGEIIGLAGLVGAGQEEVAEALAGARSADSGSASIGEETWLLRGLTPRAAIRRGVGWVPPDRAGQGLIGSLPSRENLPMLVLQRFFRKGMINWKRVRQHTQAVAVSLSVAPPDPDVLVQSLSGGNQQKELFGKSLEHRPRLLLLSEPTRGVDIGARQTLWALIRQTAQARFTICASTDYAELATLCDRVLIFRNGRIATELTGPDFTAEVIADACLRE